MDGEKTVGSLVRVIGTRLNLAFNFPLCPTNDYSSFEDQPISRTPDASDLADASKPLHSISSTSTSIKKKTSVKEAVDDCFSLVNLLLAEQISVGSCG